jgi:uncharacterized protein YutE (UPF0331/DUF86 family)
MWLPLRHASALTEKEMEIIKELGLDKCTSFDSCNKIIDSFRLRQLDRLKIVLSRLAKERVFPEEVAEGIRKNDLQAFSRALVVLNDESRENTN